MKIVSWNVNGIRACSKKGLFDYFEREQPDLFCLQETKAHPEQLDPELLELGEGQSYWSSAQKRGYSGTVIYTREEPDQVGHGINIRKFDIEGRFVSVDYSDFKLYNVYFPNGAASIERHDYKQEFLKRFTRHLVKEAKAGRELIIVGDYNVAYLDIDVYDPQRLAKTSGFLPEERKWFKEYLDCGFKDVYREFFPEQANQFSWWSYRERARIANRGWRIDHICVTPNLLKKIESVQIQDQQMGSDHCPIKMEIKV